MAQVRSQARSAKAQADSVLSDAKEHRPRGGRRVPRRRRHVRRRDRRFAEAPALRDAGDGRRHRLPVRRRLAALSGIQGAQVFDRLIATFKTEYQSLMTTLICAVVAGMAGVVGILFVGIAIFVWASNAYGTLQACIAMAGFFLVVALIAIAVLFYARSEAHKRAAKRAEVERREREEAAKNAPPIWMDPSLIPKLLAAAAADRAQGGPDRPPPSRASARARSARRSSAGACCASAALLRKTRCRPPSSRREIDSDTTGIVALDAGAQHLVARALPPVLGGKDLHLLMAVEARALDHAADGRAGRSRRRPSCRGRAAGPWSAPASRRCDAPGCARRRA